MNTVSAHAHMVTLQSKGHSMGASKNTSHLQYLVITHNKRCLNL